MTAVEVHECNQTSCTGGTRRSCGINQSQEQQKHCSRALQLTVSASGQYLVHFTTTYFLSLSHLPLQSFSSEFLVYWRYNGTENAWIDYDTVLFNCTQFFVSISDSQTLSCHCHFRLFLPFFASIVLFITFYSLSFLCPSFHFIFVILVHLSSQAFLALLLVSRFCFRVDLYFRKFIFVFSCRPRPRGQAIFVSA